MLWSYFKIIYKNTNIVAEVAAELKDVNERIKAKDSGWEHLEDISVMLRIMDGWNRDKSGSSITQRDGTTEKGTENPHSSV